MSSGATSGGITRAAYDEAFPRVGDALALYVWRSPAFELVRRAAAAGIPAAAATLLEAVLAAQVFLLFWNGHYWLGLAVAVAVTLVSVVALMLSRLTHSANRAWRAVDTVAPLLWWWAWAHGLPAYGRPLEPVYATMVLWVVVGGTIAINVIEGLAVQRFTGMEIHAWQPFDTRFRLVSAQRNSDLVIFAGALLFRRPDTGLVLVAWWTLISLIVHAVRFAQLTEQQARRQRIESWLDR